LVITLPVAPLAYISVWGLFVSLFRVPFGDEVHPPPVTRKACRCNDFLQCLKQDQVPLVEGGVGLLEVVVAAIPADAERVSSRWRCASQ
jgi:hypothetical protein